MLYREIIAVCSQIHTKHTNTLCGQNVEMLNVKLAVHIVTSGVAMVICVVIFRSFGFFKFFSLVSEKIERAGSLSIFIGLAKLVPIGFQYAFSDHSFFALP
jgi:hypothetical protein